MIFIGNRKVSPSRRHYVLGFAFGVVDGLILHAALIRKSHPEWQAGKLNGIGGRVEGREWPVEAMVREFREETGIPTNETLWRHFATIENEQVILDCFSANMSSNTLSPLNGREAPKGERIEVWPIRELYSDPTFKGAVPNLRWLVPMALDPHMVVAGVELAV